MFHEDRWCLQCEFADQSLAGPLGVLSGKPEVRHPFWEHALCREHVLCQEPGNTTTVRGSGGASLSQWFAEAPLSVAEGWKPLLADDGDQSSAHSDPCWDRPSSFTALSFLLTVAGDCSRTLVLGGFLVLICAFPMDLTCSPAGHLCI